MISEGWILIVTALVSGLIATVITIVVQRKADVRKEKLEIFKTLMANRYRIHAAENVKALNMIDIIFYKATNVRKAYEEFIREASRDVESEINIRIDDKFLRILEEMAKELKYKDINWDRMKNVYYPKGLAEIDEAEEKKIKSQLYLYSDDDLD